VLGALVISLLPELLRDLAEYRYLAFGILLVVVMVFRPQGFWPARGYEPERATPGDKESGDKEPAVAGGTK
jgi:branched-chain amino acid transport system permease protein